MLVVSVNVDFYWLPPYLNLLSSFWGPLYLIRIAKSAKNTYVQTYAETKLRLLGFPDMPYICSYCGCEQEEVSGHTGGEDYYSGIGEACTVMRCGCGKPWYEQSELRARQEKARNQLISYWLSCHNPRKAERASGSAE